MNALYLFDIFGTMIFALTGAVKAVRLKLDYLGIFIYAMTVGCGGGMVRDMLLGALPVAFFQNYLYLLVCILSAVFVIILSNRIDINKPLIVYMDAIGLGVFTALGCYKAELFNVGPVGMIVSGLFSAVGGGVLRDLFSHEIPMVFYADFYATASILGAMLFIVLKLAAVGDLATLFIVSIFVMLLRIFAFRHHWHLPSVRTK